VLGKGLGAPRLARRECAADDTSTGRPTRPVLAWLSVAPFLGVSDPGDAGGDEGDTGAGQDDEGRAGGDEHVSLDL
jgi:hypothetical protein